MTQPAMEWVDSSNIDQVGYDAATRELWVQFKSGDTYAYLDVPASTHAEFMAADSKGSYLNREIKPHYEFRRL